MFGIKKLREDLDAVANYVGVGLYNNFKPEVPFVRLSRRNELDKIIKSISVQQEELKVIKKHLGIKVSKVNQPETIYKVEELDD